MQDADMNAWKERESAKPASSIRRRDVAQAFLPVRFVNREAHRPAWMSQEVSARSLLHPCRSALTELVGGPPKTALVPASKQCRPQSTPVVRRNRSNLRKCHGHSP